jgi:ubiquinone/menaquinone biosynthesis C-methylase UbiE
MLNQCQARCETSGGRLHLVQGDSERLPFQDNAFDVITCTHSFHHYPHQQKVVAEMHRVLRPGGRLLIIDGDRDGWWGWLVYDVVVVMMEGAVRHLSDHAFRDMYTSAGFGNLNQQRRGRFLPFLLTVGEAIKPALSKPRRQAA